MIPRPKNLIPLIALHNSDKLVTLAESDNFEWGELIHTLRVSSLYDIMLLGYKRADEDHVTISTTAPIDFLEFDGVVYNERQGLYIPTREKHFRFENSRPRRTFGTNHWNNQFMAVAEFYSVNSDVQAGKRMGDSIIRLSQVRYENR
jgi:hypothetical protein